MIESMESVAYRLKIEIVHKFFIMKFRCKRVPMPVQRICHIVKSFTGQLIDFSPHCEHANELEREIA